MDRGRGERLTGELRRAAAGGSELRWRNERLSLLRFLSTFQYPLASGRAPRLAYRYETASIRSPRLVGRDRRLSHVAGWTFVRHLDCRGAAATHGLRACPSTSVDDEARKS